MPNEERRAASAPAIPDIASLIAQATREAEASADRDRDDDELHEREAWHRELGLGQWRQSIEIDQSRERYAAHERGMSIVEHRLWRIAQWRAGYAAGWSDDLLDRLTRDLVEDATGWLAPSLAALEPEPPASRKRRAREAPTTPPRSRQQAAKALLGAVDTIAKAPATERSYLLGWAVRIPAYEALRAGFGRESVVAILTDGAADAGIDEATARRVIDDELDTVGGDA